MLGAGCVPAMTSASHRGREPPAAECVAMTATLATLRKSAASARLELSLRAGVSQRHLSCIETGRARAGRATLIALLDALGATLEERNQALLAAGYAPAHAERSLDAPRWNPCARAGAAARRQWPHHARAGDGRRIQPVMVNEGPVRLIRLLGMPEAMLHQQPLNLLRVILRWRLRARCAWTKPGCAPRCGPAPAARPSTCPACARCSTNCGPSLSPDRRRDRQLASVWPSACARRTAASSLLLGHHELWHAAGHHVGVAEGGAPFPTDEATRGGAG